MPQTLSSPLFFFLKPSFSNLAVFFFFFPLPTSSKAPLLVCSTNLNIGLKRVPVVGFSISELFVTDSHTAPWLTWQARWNVSYKISFTCASGEEFAVRETGGISRRVFGRTDGGPIAFLHRRRSGTSLGGVLWRRRLTLDNVVQMLSSAGSSRDGIHAAAGTVYQLAVASCLVDSKPWTWPPPLSPQGMLGLVPSDSDQFG